MTLARINQSPIKWMNSFWNEPLGFRRFIDEAAGITPGTDPAVNIREDENSFSMELAAPGLSKEDFKMNIDKNVLTVSAEKESKTEEEKNNYRFREFNYSSFSRSFSLPKSVDQDKISAKYENGVILVTLPKRAEVIEKSTKEITIS